MMNSKSNLPDHPYPQEEGITSLYRFHSFGNDESHLRHLLSTAKLYYPKPNQLNDPFECRPNFAMPSSPKELQRLRNDHVRLFEEEGYTTSVANKLTSHSMSDPKLLAQNIRSSVLGALGETRMCSFTVANDNLLFWSHYSDSHRGFCIEYDATRDPFSTAFKVKYSTKYPELVFPSPRDQRALIPLLTKSENWDYEEEYRTVMVSPTILPFDNDGESVVLKGDEIKNIYFGVFTKEENRQDVMDMIDAGPFKPSYYLARLSDDSFALEFDPIT